MIYHLYWQKCLSNMLMLSAMKQEQLFSMSFCRLDIPKIHVRYSGVNIRNNISSVLDVYFSIHTFKEHIKQFYILSYLKKKKLFNIYKPLSIHQQCSCEQGDIYTFCISPFCWSIVFPANVFSVNVCITTIELLLFLQFVWKKK